MTIPNNDATTTPLDNSCWVANNDRNTATNNATNNSTNISNSATGTASIKALVQTSYDTIAVRYLEWATSIPSPRLELLQKLLHRLQAPSVAGSIANAKPRILELGCGAGVPTTQLLVRSGYDVTANDISATQIQLAREHVTVRPSSGKCEPGESGSVEFVLGDMMELDFPAGTFDAVLGLYSIFHLPLDEQEMLMRRVFRWLKQGGHLLINVGVMADSGTIREKFLGKEMYWSCFPESVYRDIVTREGFAFVEVRLGLMWKMGRMCRSCGYWGGNRRGQFIYRSRVDI
ncbi:hypothetical protein ACJ73_05937 [Blastomyces percursus]|uniref:Methyltransferase type 11 domain-containing protein n=1 Tax=Blastomyces percursus TaxID=1658174 RepID=A0A1J9Q2C0_9EURO|nr:hypothetical protein ACJ73_05937 [Blastomyces percursus]